MEFLMVKMVDDLGGMQWWNVDGWKWSNEASIKAIALVLREVRPPINFKQHLGALLLHRFGEGTSQECPGTSRILRETALAKHSFHRILHLWLWESRRSLFCKFHANKKQIVNEYTQDQVQTESLSWSFHFCRSIGPAPVPQFVGGVDSESQDPPDRDLEWLLWTKTARFETQNWFSVIGSTHTQRPHLCRSLPTWGDMLHLHWWKMRKWAPQHLQLQVVLRGPDWGSNNWSAHAV
jgi:hypothetical protein